VNFSFPIDLHTRTFPGTGISMANTTVVGTMVRLFLCPSDRMPKGTTTDGFAGGPDRDFAPSNSHLCAGDGANGGDMETAPDGSFRYSVLTRAAEVTDGLSNTAFGSESLLGVGVADTVPHAPGIAPPNSVDVLFLNPPPGSGRRPPRSTRPPASRAPACPRNA
jgi:hypothetical protein